MTLGGFDSFPCLNCGHPPSWHRLNDALNISPTDPAAEFRCIGYDCERPGFDESGCPVGCPDFVPPPGYLEAIARHCDPESVEEGT